MEEFLRRVFNDAALCAELQACRKREEFIALAHSHAAAGGQDVSIEAFEAALFEMGRADAGILLDEVPPSKGWLPEALSWRDGEAVVHWRFLGPRRLSEPFFSDTMRAMGREPFSRTVRPVTSFEALERYVADRPGLPLIGLVAHVSRCGSTLVSQMLASLGSLVVASEPPPMDAVLREGPGNPDRTVRVQRLRAMVHALGQPRNGTESGFVLKLDSWHLAHLSLVRDAFPGTPLVILYREPSAVLASQMREPGLHMAGIMTGPPFDGIPFAGTPLLEYRARILGRFFEAAARWEGEALLVSYSDLPGAVRDRVLPFFGLRRDSEGVEATRKVETRDAKFPHAVFRPRSNQFVKGTESGPIAEAAERWCGGSYRVLEARRSRQLAV